MCILVSVLLLYWVTHMPSHSVPLLWEKIGKNANRVKLAIPILSELFWWEKIGEVANEAKLATSYGKDWKICESGKIGHSESF